MGLVFPDSPSVSTELIQPDVVGRICRVFPLVPYKGWLDHQLAVRAALARAPGANALADATFEVLEAPFHSCLYARGDAVRIQ
ncbi:MAG: hypothetical protein GY937_02955 [bacterium]|nr:hypothetical protein [bacterium]